MDIFQKKPPFATFPSPSLSLEDRLSGIRQAWHRCVTFWTHVSATWHPTYGVLTQQGQQCPPPFFGKRNTPAPIESPAPIDVGGLGSVVRQIEDAQRKYKLAEEANFNHLKTIRELQVEKSRLNELNHTLSEEVQSAKTEIETIKQAKEDSIANAKKLVQECFDKVAVVTTAFAEYEEAAASRMEASEQAIGELRRTTAEVNNIKEGVEAHFQKSESARQVMAATAAQAVSEVKEATEGHAKAIEKLKDATEEHTRAIDAKDAIIRELMGTIATKEDHNKQLDQYIQAMVATVGDDVKSFTDQLRALKTLRGIKVADQKLIDDLRSRLHETELSKSDLENELTSEHQQEIHDMKSRHSSSLMASAQEINTLQVANASLKQEVKDLQEKLQTKEAEAKANDIKLREAATVAHAGGESIQAQLESEIETMRTEKKQVEVRIESYQREIQLSIKELKADIAQKTQQLQQVPKLEKENAILQTQLSKAKDQSNAAEAELQRAKVEISQFKDSAPTTSGVKDLQSKVADLRQRIEDKDAHMKHLNSLVEAAQTLSNSYQSDLAKKTEDNEMFSALQLAEIDDLKRQLQGASKETTEEDRAFQSAVEQPLRTEARNKDNVIRELQNDLKKFAPNARSTNTSRGDVPTTKKAPAPAPAPKIRAGSVSSLSDVGAVEESTINNSAGQNSNGKRPISAVEDEENESDDDADWLLAAENAARSAADPQTKKPAVKQTKANARSDAVPERRASGGPMF
ncbi:hypothetical protein Q8F55_005746 [Vanrija albida]|uniref:Nucleoprotein TPR/MLP1 domain-containing protein n=1 Tax=Vanrija albida TaxID=181172 RepID=A0ABR3Q321_9TREE